MKEKYSKTFGDVVAETWSLNFPNLGLNAELTELKPTLELCKHRLRVLDLSKNSKITGTLAVLSMCETLEILKLNDCNGLTGALR